MLTTAALVNNPQPRLVHETSGLLFVDKPAGLSFHASAESNDPGIMPILRRMCLSGEIAHDGRLYSVHRLDRVTSGLLMVAKTPEAAAAAAELLRERGAGKVYAGVSHGVLGEIGHERLSKSVIEELITTDSTPMAVGPKVTTLSVAGLMGEGIRRIHNDESVTSLFDISPKSD